MSAIAFNPVSSLSRDVTHSEIINRLSDIDRKVLSTCTINCPGPKCVQGEAFYYADKNPTKTINGEWFVFNNPNEPVDLKSNALADSPQFSKMRLLEHTMTKISAYFDIKHFEQDFEQGYFDEFQEDFLKTCNKKIDPPKLFDFSIFNRYRNTPVEENHFDNNGIPSLSSPNISHNEANGIPSLSGPSISHNEANGNSNLTAFLAGVSTFVFGNERQGSLGSRALIGGVFLTTTVLFGLALWKNYKKK